MSDMDYVKIAGDAGWEQCAADSEWSWQKSDGATVRGHFAVDLMTGRPLKMDAKELCEREGLI